MNKEFKIKMNRLGLGGKHCVVLKEGKLVQEMSEKYGRDVALKIFELCPIDTPEGYKAAKWGDDPKKGEVQKNNTIFESSQIQNILSWYKKSSRIYGLETFYFGEKYYVMQVIEYTDGDFYHSNDALEVKKITDPINELGQMFGFKADVHKVSKNDIIDNKLIDVHPYHFVKDYRDTVRELYCRNKYGKVYYQDVEEIDLHGGPRKSEDRIKYLGLDRINFDGKIVADVGCSGGFFTRYADHHGAKRVYGYDLPDQIDSARNVANYLGYWNIDYIPTNLEKDLWEVHNCDIVFFLSLNYHIGIPTQILKANMVILEDNGKESRLEQTLGEPWTSNFSRIEFIGLAHDHGDKPVYHLYK